MKSAGEEDMRKGCIFQINPKKANNLAFAGCLIVLDEVKPWGIAGFIPGVGTREMPGGLYPYRATWEEIEPTGGKVAFEKGDG
jgi:hypothetical protein